MELFDRYLKLVKFFLPRAEQDDIIRELSEDIQSQVEEKEAILGRALNKAEQKELIGQLGHPALLAGRYGPRRQLIGPELFPFYWLVLRIALTVNLLAHVIATAIAFAMGQSVNPVLRLVSAAGALFIAFGIVTIVFALLDRYRPAGIFTRRWDTTHLSTVTATRPRRPSAISRIATATIFLIWWVAARRSPALLLGAGAEVFKLAPVWESAFIWIVGLNLVGIANACLELASPQWNRIRVAARLIGTAGSLALLLFLLSAGPFVVLVDPIAQAGRLDVAARVINQSVYWALSIAALVVGFKGIIELRAWSRDRRTQRPEDTARVLAVLVGAILVVSTMVA